MTGIALYEALKKIPDLSDAEAKEAVADITNSKDMATKMGIVRVESAIVEIKTELKYLRWLIVVVVGIAVGIIKYL